MELPWGTIRVTTIARFGPACQSLRSPPSGHDGPDSEAGDPQTLAAVIRRPSASGLSAGPVTTTSP